MWKENELNSLMRDEAAASADCVAAQLCADEERYYELGVKLSLHEPSVVVTIARGSSDHAASYFAYLCMSRGGQVVSSLPMSLVTLYNAPLTTRGVLAVAISQSGRSPDLKAPVELYRNGGGTTVALVNDAASPLAAAAQWMFPLHAGPERSVAATKSFICSLVAAVRLVAHWRNDPSLLHGVRGIPNALKDACTQDWSAGVEALRDAQRIMVIGRGAGLAIAQEAALKFKETCGIQAEAFSAAEVKHGPMALVDDGYPMLIFAPRGPAQSGVLALAEEMRARGARVILAAPSDVPNRTLTMTTCGTADLDPITAIQSFYLMVEELARARGHDPDKPPHLNKVTATL